MQFQALYSKELRGKIIPWWLLESMRLVYAAAVFAAAYYLTGSVVKAYFFWVWMIFMQLAWQKCMAFVSKKMTVRYFSSKPDLETYSGEIAGDRYVTEHDVTRRSFPLSALADVSEKEGYIYMDFPKIGRARLPVSVFQSAEEKAGFLAELEEGKKAGIDAG